MAIDQLEARSSSILTILKSRSDGVSREASLVIEALMERADMGELKLDWRARLALALILFPQLLLGPIIVIVISALYWLLA